jgi:hypothetical protein
VVIILTLDGSISVQAGRPVKRQDRVTHIHGSLDFVEGILYLRSTAQFRNMSQVRNA